MAIMVIPLRARWAVLCTPGKAAAGRQPARPNSPATNPMVSWTPAPMEINAKPMRKIATQKISAGLQPVRNHANASAPVMMDKLTIAQTMVLSNRLRGPCYQPSAPLARFLPVLGRVSGSAQLQQGRLGYP